MVDQYAPTSGGYGMKYTFKDVNALVNGKEIEPTEINISTPIPECSTCAEGITGKKVHPCPFQEEIFNNYKPYCDCCEACQKHCMEDI